MRFDSQLGAADFRESSPASRNSTESDGEELPQDPMEQLRRSLDAVFGSWNNPQAVRYPEIHEIKGLLGTAVNIQTTPLPSRSRTSIPSCALTQPVASAKPLASWSK